MTAKEYMQKYGLVIGRHYSTGVSIRKLVGVKECDGQSYIVFDDGTKYTTALPFTWTEVAECEEQESDTSPETIFAPEEKEEDANYRKLKARHKELCDRKRALMDTGKVTTMRNAYINQGLDQIRAELEKC